MASGDSGDSPSNAAKAAGGGGGGGGGGAMARRYKVLLENPHLEPHISFISLM